MKSFRYTVQNRIGLHARPAGLLIMAARSYQSEITLEMDGRSADLKNLMSVLALNVKQYDEILIRAQGADEERAIMGLEAFARENL